MMDKRNRPEIVSGVWGKPLLVVTQVANQMQLGHLSMALTEMYETPFLSSTAPL